MSALDYNKAWRICDRPERAVAHPNKREHAVRGEYMKIVVIDGQGGRIGKTIIALDESVPVLERLTRTILSLNVDSELGDMIMEQVHKPQNALLHQKLQEKLLGRVNVLITKIVEDGINQGIMHTDYPDEAVDMIMTYSYVTFDSERQYDAQEEQRKIAGFVYHTERILCMEPGMLMDAMKPIFFK